MGHAAARDTSRGNGPGDELVDLYPGSGAVSQAWRRYTTAPSTGDTSRADAWVDDDNVAPARRSRS